MSKKVMPSSKAFWMKGRLFSSCSAQLCVPFSGVPYVMQGGEAYLPDLPKAEMHRLEAGHFAVEDCLDYISENMHRFYSEKLAGSKVKTEK